MMESSDYRLQIIMIKVAAGLFQKYFQKIKIILNFASVLLNLDQMPNNIHDLYYTVIQVDGNMWGVLVECWTKHLCT